MIRTYVDSGVLIAGVHGEPALTRRALALLVDSNRVFLASAFLRLELLPKATYHRNRAELAFYQAFFDSVVAWAEPLDRVVEAAEREATRHGLNALDALHVAAAAMLGADELVTTEGPAKPIHRTASVKVISI